MILIDIDPFFPGSKSFLLRGGGLGEVSGKYGWEVIVAKGTSLDVV